MIDIIIPVFNTPIVDLKRCFNSILNQDYKDYKVYIIDDGSSLDVRGFLDFYVSDKENFIVKHIKNKGVANARNVGISISSSKYITFVDSDDTVHRNFLSESIKLLIDNDLDLIIGGYNEVCNNRVLKVRKCLDGLYIYDRNNINLFFDKLLSGKLRVDNKEINSAPIGRIYTRLYKRIVLENVRFNDKVKISEDTLFMIDLMEYVNRIGVVSSIWYDYYQNDYSIVHSSNYKKLVDDNLFFMKEVYNRLKKVDDIDLKNAYRMRIVKTFFNMVMKLDKNNDLDYRDKLLKMDIINESLRNVNINYYIDMSSSELELLNRFK